MESTVEAVCNLLARSRLRTPDEVRALHQRWRKEAKDAAADLDQFSHWLVANQYVTEYQANLLRRGHGEHFFFNDYKILDRIGKGRMAGVYRGVHSLGQVVAIKVLPPSKAKQPQLLARFQREARLALRLKHPNVVRAFETGQVDGLHYLVMELLEGETLEDVLERRGKLPPAEALRIIHQALQGLQHIHEQGLVHRDVKPGNLMLVRGTEPGDTTLDTTVKILDIGLGKALFDERTPGEADNFDLTTEGTLLGTPAYLAPEQARDAHQADIRADIYSLGCVLYHTLAGQPPFPETNLVRQMLRHATEMPRPIAELVPGVPDGLQQALNLMLAKDPAQRFPTPERALQALQVLMVREQEPARRSKVEGQMPAYEKWLEAHPSQNEVVAVAHPTIPLAPAADSAQPAPPPRDPAPIAAATRERSAGPPQAARSRTSKSPPEAEAGFAAAEVELVPVDLSKQTTRGEPKPFELTRRDYVLLAIGAVGVLLAEAVGVLVARLIRGRLRTPDAAAPEKEGGEADQ
jgi:serine/threonine protein kinase